MIRICDGLRVSLKQFSPLFRINLHIDSFYLSMMHLLAVNACSKLKKETLNYFNFLVEKS